MRDLDCLSGETAERLFINANTSTDGSDEDVDGVEYFDNGDQKVMFGLIAIFYFSKLNFISLRYILMLQAQSISVIETVPE